MYLLLNKLVGNVWLIHGLKIIYVFLINKQHFYNCSLPSNPWITTHLLFTKLLHYFHISIKQFLSNIALS